MATRRPTRRRKRAPAEADFENELVQWAGQGRFKNIAASCEKESRHRQLSARAMHVYGVALTQLERFDLAIETLRRAAKRSGIDGNADQTRLINNDLSKAYFASKDYSKAIETLTALLNANPDEIAFARNLILVLEESGQIDSAIERCRSAVKQWPSDVKLALQLGDLLMGIESWNDAADAYTTAIRIDPSDDYPRQKLVTVYRRLDDHDQVEATLREWLAVAPENAVAGHLLSAIQSSQPNATAVPQRASDDYVRQVFDQFAETFDDQLASLGYVAPRQFSLLLDKLGIPKDQSLAILDAGCGTGLMGEYLSPYAKHLVGVDLSSEMLRLAKERDYDTLVCSELVNYLTANREHFDLILAADTLIYIGDLLPVCQAAHAALCGNHRMFVFSIEQWQREERGQTDEPAEQKCGYHLNPSGRYSHDEQYVREVLERSGFCDIRAELAPIRNEADKEVDGLYWSARKPSDG